MGEIERDLVKVVVMLPDGLNKRLEQAQRAVFMTNRADFIRILIGEALTMRGF